MKRLIFILAMSLCFLGCDKPAADSGDPAAATSAAHDHAGECSCGEGKSGGTAWCDGCGVGFVNGEKTKDKAAVTAALAGAKAPAAKAPAAKGHDHDHAHGAGHDHDHGAACACGAGKKGATVWCDKCGAGYIKGEKTTDKAAVTAALAAAKPAAAVEAKPAAAAEPAKKAE